MRKVALTAAAAPIILLYCCFWRTAALIWSSSVSTSEARCAARSASVISSATSCVSSAGSVSGVALSPGRREAHRCCERITSLPTSSCFCCWRNIGCRLLAVESTRLRYAFTILHEIVSSLLNGLLLEDDTEIKATQSLVGFRREYAMPEHPSRRWDVLLIGGASGTGKS